MAILKCKMCGGDIELSADKTFGTCESCGSTMTFPKVDDEQRANAFNRGNLFRRSGEFDKALAVYERIVQENEDDAEAHWCCALCRFGIEYVEDPNTFEYLPTCHRASFDSFLEDVDYLAALEHSDGITRRQYQKDAAKIAEVQRGILATSQNEEPFDVFICYKESENDGSRTRDSLLAQDIYYQLTEQGRRVFFSRITLEDKAGTEYEPYIFAALNSAKVMILVTTSAEHANAVWVKNEWSRFLSLMRKDRSKLLLPCYRDMDPYDLPEALSVLQSYDMSKIGFIQDLTRGVNKVLDAERPKQTLKETVVVQQGNANAAPLLKRAFMFLEDGDFARADEFCEQVLNLDPENSEAYLGKLMAELHVKTRDALKDQPEPFDNRNNYKKAIRFGNAEMRDFFSDCTETIHKTIIERQEADRRRKEADRKRINDEIIKTLLSAKGHKSDLRTMLIAALAHKTNELSAIEGRIAALDNDLEHAGVFRLKEKKGIQNQINALKDEKIHVKKESNEKIITLQKQLHVASRNLQQTIADSLAQIDDPSIIEQMMINDCSDESLYQAISEGDPFIYGEYWQREAEKDGKEDIEWIVLNKAEGRILVISKYALDYKQYHSSGTHTKWDDCSLKTWLNGDFLNAAFSAAEQHKIACIDQKRGSIFLMDMNDINSFLPTNGSRKCKATRYVRAKTNFANEENGNCRWWLQASGLDSGHASTVEPDGFIDELGDSIYFANAIRPVMWVSVE